MKLKTLHQNQNCHKAGLLVDAECEDHYKVLAVSAVSKKWSAFSKSQYFSFRVDEKEWQDLFKTPAILQAAKDYLRSVNMYDP